MPRVSCDPDGRVTDVDDAFCRLVGRPPEDVVGRPLAELDHVSDPGSADARLRELLTGRVEVVSAERVLQASDGSRVPVLLGATLRRDRTGVAMGTTAFVQDLGSLEEAERLRRGQEELFLALALSASDLATVADAKGHLRYVSPAAQSMFGYAAAEEPTRPGWDFVHPEDLAGVQAEFEALLRDGGTRTVSLRVQAADGRWRHVEQTMSNMLHTPVRGIVCHLRDVTELVAAQQALATSEARYRAIAENAHEGIWVANRDGSTAFVNARMLDITGLTTEEAHQSAPIELLEGVEARQMQERLGTRETVGAEQYEIDYRHPDGGLRRLLVSAAPLRDDAGFEGSLALVSDITASRSATRQLQHAAQHDTLTDLPNRAQLQQGAASALARSPDSTAVLFIDLDNFKEVNDGHGHGVGDDLLRDVAQRLQAAVRPGDLVARFGGDEFVVVCEKVTAATARLVGERLLRAVEEPMTRAGSRVHVTASIGIALSPAASVEQLLREADAAMYAAKDAGRRRLSFFDDSPPS
jgi:diguanylate cyclase (GGDEF)-like protein/PAS domain S-box-containing protein